MPADLRDVLEELERLVDRHVEHVGDRLALVADLERLGVVARARAGSHSTQTSGRKCISILHLPVALARLAAAARHVEAEAAAACSRAPSPRASASRARDVREEVVVAAFDHDPRALLADCPRRRCAATARAVLVQRAAAAAARRARATGRSRSRCTSCPTSRSPARRATGARYNRETLEVRYKGKRSPTCSRWRSRRRCSSSRRSRRSAAPADAARRRPRLHDARPAGDDALGRRGAAGKLAPELSKVATGRDALHPRRADDRPALRRHREAARRAAPAGRRRQHGAS